MSALRVRPGSAEDDAELLTWFPTPEDLLRFAGPDVQWPLSADQLARWRADPQIRVWAATSGAGRIVGYTQLVDTEPGSARLARVAVAPHARGAGVGGALLAAVLRDAQERGLACVDLNVYEDNEPARRLYGSLGFVDLGPTPGYDGMRRMGRRL